MSTETPTPRTDAAPMYYVTSTLAASYPAVPATFARTLERELNAAKQRIAELEAAPTPLDRPDAPGWYSCDKILPDANARVIAHYRNVYSYRLVTVWYDGGGNVHFGLPSEPDGKGSQPATHWMPLPANPPAEPVREGGE